MDVKKYLNQVREADIEITRLLNKIAKSRERAESYGAFLNPDRPRVQESNHIKDRQAEMVTAMVDDEKEWWDKVVKTRQLRAKIEREIEQLPNGRHRAILDYRYLQFMDWGDILEILPKQNGEKYEDVRGIYLLHGEALNSFRKNFPSFQ